MHIGLDLEAEAGGHLDQFHATLGAGLAQQFQCALHAAGRRRFFFRKQACSCASVSGWLLASRAASIMRVISA